MGAGGRISPSTNGNDSSPSNPCLDSRPSHRPLGAEKEITVDFSGEYGDRRQEIVFIGQFDEKGASSKKSLEQVLDYCLLTDAEMAEYNKLADQGDTALRNYFVKPL